MLDAHQHFWTVSRGDYGWMGPEIAPIVRDFGPDDLAPLLRRAGVTRTILVQAAETEAETEFLLDIAARTDFVAGVVGWLDMSSDDFPNRLARHLERPKWVGLRPMLQDHAPETILSPAFLRNLRHVADERVPFDILIRPEHLDATVDAVTRTPGLHAVIDHMAKPDIAAGALDPWRDAMATLARHPGLHCKVSGLVTEAGPGWSADDIRPYVDHVAEVFGPARLIFGSDWPVCTLAAGYDQVLALAQTLLSERFGPEQLRAIFETNGAEFYGLD